MPEENMNQEFRLKKIEEIRNYLKNQNKLMSKKHKKVCRALNYIEHLLIVTYTITGCASISAFASLVGIPIGTASSTVGLKICVINTTIKKYTSIIKKKWKEHVKTVLLAKSKLNNIEVLISKSLIPKFSKFKIGDFVRISKCKNIFAKGYTPTWFEEVFVIKKVKDPVPLTYYYY